jgi:protein-disulfide isomerase
MPDNSDVDHVKRAELQGATESAPKTAPRPTLPAAPDMWQRISIVLPLIAVAISLAVWYRTRSDLEVIRDSQRALFSEIASVRRSAVIDLSGAPMAGSPSAVVTLVEFSDYECPFCIRHFQQTMPEVSENYIKTGRIRYAFRDFPVDQLHPEAIRAHEAAHCAGEQSKFWDLHTKLFTAPGTHTPQNLEARAGEAGLDLTAYRACIASGRTTASIRANAAEAIDLGASGTPAFFVGVLDRATNQVKVTQAITGAQPFSVFEKAFANAQKQSETK